MTMATDLAPFAGTAGHQDRIKQKQGCSQVKSYHFIEFVSIVKSHYLTNI